jgi:hypothetical protein
MESEPRHQQDKEIPKWLKKCIKPAGRKDGRKWGKVEDRERKFGEAITHQVLPIQKYQGMW